MGQKLASRKLGNNNSRHNRLKKVPDDIDGRSKEAQQFRNIVNSTIKLAGNRQPPAVVEQLAKQYAGLILRQEHHQSRLFGGDERGTSDAAYVKLVNSANRCLRLLGLTQIKDGEDDGDINALEKHCAKRMAELDSKKSKRRKVDRRRERLGR